MRPCSSTCWAVISSCGARNPSISDLWAKSSKMTHPRLQISEENVRGVAGSKNASGGRSTRGVYDSYRDLSSGRKATPKSLSIKLASARVISLLGMPSHAEDTAYEGTQGSFDAVWVSRRTTGSCSGAPYRAYSCCIDRLFRDEGNCKRRLPRWRSIAWCQPSYRCLRQRDSRLHGHNPGSGRGIGP